MQEFADAEKVLGELDNVLHEQYLTTNRNIHEGDNPFVKLGKAGLFSIKTPKKDEVDAVSLQSFFPERHYVPRPPPGGAGHRQSLHELCR
jgi:hypothetical protein